MTATMDQRFWQQKKRVPFYNATDQTVPAYSPIAVRMSSNLLSQLDEDDLVFTGSYVYPTFGNGLNTSSFESLVFINGPQDVPPHSFGTASRDYPLPCLIDPDSYPIWDGNPLDAPTLGDFDAYNGNAFLGAENPELSAEFLPNFGGATDFPPLGLSSVASSGGAQQFFFPASFTPDIPLWKSLYFDMDADGALTKNRVVVTPAVPYARPIAGQWQFQFANEDEVNSEGSILIPPFAVVKDGYYTFAFHAEVEIDTPGAAAEIRLGVLSGPNSLTGGFGYANNITGTNTPLVYPIRAGRKMPKFHIDTDSDQPYQSEQDEDKVVYDDYGYETVGASINIFLRKGDKFQLDVYCPGDAANVIVTNGLLIWRQVGDILSGNGVFAGPAGGGFPANIGQGWYLGGYGNNAGGNIT